MKKSRLKGNKWRKPESHEGVNIAAQYLTLAFDAV